MGLVLLALCFQAPANAGKTERRKARAFFKLGKKLFAKKKYAEAIEAFTKAERYWKHRVIHFNIALSYAFLGKKILAAKRIKEYLKTATAAERNLPEVLQKVQQETGTLIIQTPDPKAAIFVDGRFVGNGRVRLILMVGKHAADIRVGKVVVAGRIIVVPPAGEKVWELAEVPQPTPPRPARKTRKGRIAAGTQPGTQPEPARRGLGRLHWAYFTAAAVLTAGAVGAAVGMYYKWQDALEKYDEGGQTDASLRKKGILYWKTTFGLFGAAGGAAAAAVVLGIFTRWRKPEKNKQVSVMPGVTPGSVGLTVRFSY